MVWMARAAVATVIIGSLVGGCSRSATTMPVASPAQADPLGMGEAKCSVVASHTAPFVVEWDGSDRAQLEAAIRRGVVAVRYGGCTLEVLPGCTAPTAYDYAALTPKKESVEIEDASELYARFPRGAVKLEAELERAGSLAVDMMLVGRLEAQSVRIEREQLQGATCGSATHVVTGLTVGAFRLHTGRKEDIEVDLALGRGATAGGARHEGREQLSSDGDVASCEGASVRDREPPVGCGALIRIEVLPLGDFERREEVAAAQRPLFAHGTPWRKPAVIGTATLVAGFVGMAVMTVGIATTQSADDPFTDGIEDPRTRAAGVAMIAVGATMFYGGVPTGVTFLSIAGVRKRKAKRAAGLALAPGGLQLRF